MKNTLLSFLEKYGPLLISVFLTSFFVYFEINWITNEDINHIAEVAITAASILVGLIGALIPILTGMRDTTKYIRLVMNTDGGKLLKKYSEKAILTGLIFIVVCLFVMFNKSYDRTFIYNKVFYIWLFTGFIFLTNSFRCLNFTLKLMYNTNESVTGIYHGIPNQQ